MMKATKTTWVVFIYALCITAGGVLGYCLSGSKASLISGLVFGVALLFSSALMLKKKIVGSYLAFGLAIVLEGVFTFRFAKTLNFIPSGLLSLLSLAVIILVALKVGKRLKMSR